MANEFLTPDFIRSEESRRPKWNHDHLSVGSVVGCRVGDTITVRVPQRFKASMEPQPRADAVDCAYCGTPNSVWATHNCRNCGASKPKNYDLRKSKEWKNGPKR